MLSTKSSIGEKDLARREDVRRLENAISSLKERNGPEASDLSAVVRAEVEKELGQIRPPQASSFGAPDDRLRSEEEKERKYWRCRRSIKLWPISGNCSEELWRGCEAFLDEKMKYPVRNLSDADFEEISRCPPGNPLSRVKDEVLVVLANVGIRDSIAAHAKNLRNCIDADGRPTAGQRIDIPDHLTGAHKELDQYGKQLRKIHGPGLKRNIKFDDASSSLIMDVKLPDEEEWIRVDRTLAKEERLSSEKTRAKITRERLTSSTSSTGETDVVSMQAEAPSIASETSVSGANSIPVSATLRKFGARAPALWGNRV